MRKLTGDQRGASDGRGALENVDEPVDLAGVDATAGIPGIGTVDMATAQPIQLQTSVGAASAGDRDRHFAGLGAADPAALS